MDPLTLIGNVQLTGGSRPSGLRRECIDRVIALIGRERPSSHRTRPPSFSEESPAARCLGRTRSLHAISAASRYLILHAPRRARSHTPRVHPIIHDSLNRMGDKRCEPVSSLPPCALQVSWIAWSEVYMSDSNNASESATPWQRSATVRPAPRTRMKNPTHRG